MGRLRIEPRHAADLQAALGLLFPVVAGVAAFGWRALGVIALVLAGAMLAYAFLGRLRSWSATGGLPGVLTQAAIVALFCPATLFDPDRANFQLDARWPALVAIGGCVAVLAWAARRVGRQRFNAAVVTAALVTLCLPGVLRTDRVLSPNKLVAGDILDANTADRPAGTAEPWLDVPRGTAAVLVTPPAVEALQNYLNDRPPPGRANQTLVRLLSDDLPPLEDLVVGGHPAGVGRGSVVAALIGGLFLAYRGYTPLRVPAMALFAGYLTLAVLPLPVSVGGGHGRRWLFERDFHVGWAAGLTLVHYLLAASPLPLVAAFLATRPDVRGRWPAVFAIVFGILAAVATVFVSVAGGALLALVVVQAIWPRRLVPSPM